jgi:hypothetical protein
MRAREVFVSEEVFDGRLIKKRGDIVAPGFRHRAQQRMPLFPAPCAGLHQNAYRGAVAFHAIAGECLVKRVHQFFAKGVAVAIIFDLVLDQSKLFVNHQYERHMGNVPPEQIAIKYLSVCTAAGIDQEQPLGRGPQ